MLVCATVPVSQFEPESIITKSIECLKELECDNFDFEINYLIETFPDDTRTLSWTLPDNFKILLRTPRGHKAGAINDFLSVVKNADYIAVFDVDSRPAKDYVVKCVAALEENDSAVLSTGCLVINNTNSILTKIVSIEYALICDSHLLSWSEGFFPVGSAVVIKVSLLEGEKLNEESWGEDFDLMTRLYLKRRVSVHAKTVSETQTPDTLKDLYNQRVRWHRGMVQSFSTYLIPMVKAPIPFSRKILWSSTIMAAFCWFLFSPYAISLFLVNRHNIRKLSDSPLDTMKILLGSIGFTLFRTACGFVALAQHLTSRKPEWKSSMRSDI